MKIRVTTKLIQLAAVTTASAVMLAGSPTAQAVPSFARQTGMPCAACHTVFPELTSFGRQFKLNGYTLTGLKQIQEPSGTGTGGLKINEIPPLSAMLVVCATNNKKGTTGTQNNAVEFPQQLSFFFAGEITPHIGSFMQVTYEQASGSLGMDNVDIRYANHTTFGGADTIYGLTLNNNPTVEDPWNTAPAWRFPFMSSDTANGPAAAALIDGALGQDVAGLGGYGMWNGHLYGNVSLYRSAHQGQGDGLGAPFTGSTQTIKGAAPYWRFAWEQNFGANTLEVGTFGMKATLYPNGVSGVTNKYTDLALDAQYEMPMGNNLLALHGIYIHEKQKLDVNSHKLNTFRLNGIYHWGNDADAALGYFSTTGDVGASGLSTKPDSKGFVAQASYLPWQNTKFGVQYTAYNKFDGASSHASDNNSLYLFGWFMW